MVNYKFLLIINFDEVSYYYYNYNNYNFYNKFIKILIEEINFL